jgi:uncharacterized membrane protein
MAFLWLKIIHVISSCVLFGTGLGTAFYMFYVNFQKDIELIALATKQVVFADWLFTGTSGVIQFITGMVMVYLKGYGFTQAWIFYSIVGYLIALSCWLPVVYLQIQCRDMAFEAVKMGTALPKKYYDYYRIWWILGIPAFVSLVIIFFLMTNRPVMFF